jgi:hypothetical protein
MQESRRLSRGNKKFDANFEEQEKNALMEGGRVDPWASPEIPQICTADCRGTTDFNSTIYIQPRSKLPKAFLE